MFIATRSFLLQVLFLSSVEIIVCLVEIINMQKKVRMASIRVLFVTGQTKSQGRQKIQINLKIIKWEILPTSI